MHINADDVLTNASANLQAGDHVVISVERGEDEIVISWDVVMDDDGTLILAEDESDGFDVIELESVE